MGGTQPRICFVGGGSTHWTPMLLLDLVNTPSLQEAHVVLTDIAAGSLPPMLELAEHLGRVRAVGLEVTATTDLDEALEGADFVVTALSVGGFDAMRHDIEIPARYGLRQPVGDSVGPGGIARALRSVPVVVGIARAMERLCPDALLVNVSNPLSALCRAVTRETSIAAVGLCSEMVGFQWTMSLLFDADMRGVDPVVGGVNHFPLVTSLGIGGADGFAMVRELVDDPGDRAGDPIWMAPPDEAHWRKVTDGESWTKADVLANNRVKLELFRRFGVMPGASDTHVVEFLSGFVTEASDFGRDWGVHHYGMAGHKADKVVDDASVGEMLKADELRTWTSGELVAPLLDGIVTGKARHLPVNLPNRGQVVGLGEGAVVECVGVSDAEGVRARDETEVEGLFGELLRRVVASQELTVEAALTGDSDTVLAAVLTDQLGARLPYEHAVTMTDELLAATARWLPQFEH